METPPIPRIQQLSDCYNAALSDMRDNLGPKRWTRGKWTGADKIKKHMLSYGKGKFPKIKPEEVDWFLQQTPFSIAEHFRNDKPTH